MKILEKLAKQLQKKQTRDSSKIRKFEKNKRFWKSLINGVWKKKNM